MVGAEFPILWNLGIDFGHRADVCRDADSQSVHPFLSAENTRWVFVGVVSTHDHEGLFPQLTFSPLDFVVGNSLCDPGISKADQALAVVIVVLHRHVDSPVLHPNASTVVDY